MIFKIFKRYREEQNKKDIDYNTAMEIIKNNKTSILIDVRSKQEYIENNIKGSINIPLYELRKKADEVLKDKNQTIIVCCQSGGRSKKAVEILSKMGYTNLFNLKGGLDSL